MRTPNDKRPVRTVEEARSDLRKLADRLRTANRQPGSDMSFAKLCANMMDQ